MTLRVAIDGQIFFTQPRGGVSRYFVELLREFGDGADGVEAVTPFQWVASEVLVDAFPTRFRRVPDAMAGSSERLRLLNRLRPHRPVSVDVVHHTYFRERFLDDTYRARARVCTVYDMLAERHPDWLTGVPPHWDKDAYVREADAVLCISEATRRHVLEHYGDLDKPVVVTHLGVRDDFAQRAVGVHVGAPYLLFVGHRQAYKNFQLLAAAVDLLPGRPDLRIVCAGGIPITDAERAEWPEGVRHRVDQLTVTDAELAGLFRGAGAFVFTSRFEGFGLPLLEAFAAGCPAVITDVEALTEVAAGAALVVGPEDPQGLATHLDRILGDSNAADGLRRAGARRARDFSWARTARETAEAYQAALLAAR